MDDTQRPQGDGGDESLLNFVYQIPVAVLRADARGTIDLMNPRAASLLAGLGLPFGDRSGLAVLEALDADLLARLRDRLEEPGTVADQQPVEWRDPRGHRRDLVLTVVVVDRGVFMLAIEDNTRRIEQERQLLLQRRGLDVVLESIRGYCVLSLDLDLRVSQYNRSVQRMLGFSEAVVGLPLAGLVDLPAEALARHVEHARRQGWAAFEAEYLGAGGLRVWGDTVLSTLVDETGDPAGLIAVVRDVSERRRREQDARRSALLDPLTGVLNRRGLDEGLRQLSPPRDPSAWLSVVAVDLDHFKSINDREGHAAGDAVLRAVGALLSRSCRDADFAVRLGGEEFLLVLPNTSPAQAASVAERVRAQIAMEVVTWQDRTIRATASFGVAGARGAAAIDALVQAADEALYAAKVSGRDRVHVAPAVVVPGEGENR